MNVKEPDQTTQERLESWKEIGAYLQRDARTARRWELEEGLPVHRHTHNSRSSVYAYPREIDAWRLSRKVVPEPPPAPVRTFWRVPSFALAILLCLVMVGNGIRPQAASAKSGPLAKRLVCTDGCLGADEANVSRDGRSLVLPHGDHNDLAIRDLATGQVKRLMVVSGKEKLWDAWPDMPVFSPDRKSILYVWHEKTLARTQLRLMGKEPGSKPRVLVEIPEKVDYTPEDWFPDGKSALVLIGKLGADRPDFRQFARVSMSDGAVTVLKSLGTRACATRPRLSPDGRYIVYSALAVNPGNPPAPTDPSGQHLYVLAVDGSSEAEIVNVAGSNGDPVWTPDGRHILFISNRSGKDDLWSIAILNGKAAGQESLVSGDLGNGLEALGIADGSYFYSTTQNDEHIHIVKISPSGSVPELEGVIGLAPTFSPDGKSLAFKRHHPGGDRYDLVIHSLETGEERTPLAEIGTTDGRAARWSHDGASVTTEVWRDHGARGFFRIDLRSGALEEPLPYGNCGLYMLSPDEKTLYMQCNTDDHGTYRVLARDRNTGQERVLATFADLWGAPSADLSPDGRTLAIGWIDGPLAGSRTDPKLRLARVSADGGDFREIWAPTGRIIGGGTVVWDPDGGSILFIQAGGDGDKWGVMRVPADGGSQPTLVFAGELSNLAGFDVSRDGSRIVYRSSERATTLWALDNVLPMLK
ncbi:MAG TPA: hypothetical protein VGN17_18170 [Bryobacteraceae bacterium]|jgi:Tol biopolymer transport system component